MGYCAVNACGAAGEYVQETGGSQVKYISGKRETQEYIHRREMRRVDWDGGMRRESETWLRGFGDAWTGPGIQHLQLGTALRQRVARARNMHLIEGIMLT